ncbi:hypothetical protein B0H16DRAFT_1681915 [Mycena metata]|uniref:Uncharacterized protein n=1 Tax=Mycena metata TaxID=1033252 RepID=A0AAD7KH45_9AGAR|nr:hypothetical protein B0H16DRAFT_1681915 [Mycena metata]
MRRSSLPSPSPAPRYNSRSFYPPRIADEAPPLKRQRCSSTRRSRASSSASPDNLELEREASTTRMLNVWANLAAKYSRPIDEDDIVDLVTGEIVKDRGVLNAEIPRKFPRSCGVDESTGTDEDDEDDVDELDAFTRTEEVLVHLDGTAVQPVPPVREMGPADAKDLEEFLEAEKKRREECGEDENEDDVEHEYMEDEAAVLPASPRVAVDDSDDELGAWGIVDESNSVSFTIKRVKNSEIITNQQSQSRSSSLPQKSPRAKKIPKLHWAPTHLLTPPRSTPSFTDEFSPRVLASPPSSLAPSQSSSPTKPKSKHIFQRVEQVRTRSQSRARSQDVGDPHPRLDSNDVHRRSARTRSSVPKPREESVRAEESMRSSARRFQPSRSPSQPEQQTRRKDQGRRDSLNKLGPSDRKGKRKTIDVGPPVQDDHWAEESDDPPGLSSSPSGLSKGKLSHGSRTNRLQGYSRSTPEVEYTTLPPSPASLPRSPRKRRRKSSSENEDLPRLPLYVHDSPRPFEASSSKMRSSAVYKSPAAVELNHPDSEPNIEIPSSHRRRHTPAPIPPYYPPGFYPYPYVATDIHSTMPLPDPRAQFIISQAMHQLSTLFTQPWSAQPLTPPRHASSPLAFRFSPYPHLPFHPHAPRHPSVIESDAGASAGTLPTFPPAFESSSSSPVCAHGGTAKPSLVPRSRSRGRHVSFEIDEDPPNDVVTVTRQRANDSGSLFDARVRRNNRNTMVAGGKYDTPETRVYVNPPGFVTRHPAQATKTHLMCFPDFCDFCICVRMRPNHPESRYGRDIESLVLAKDDN